MIPLLAPLFQGEIAAYGETLALASRWPDDGLEITRLLDGSGALEEAIQRHATHLGVKDQDLRAAASAWSLEYLGALLPPVVAAASVLEHRFPMRPDQVAVTLNPIGVPTRFHIVELGMPMPRTSTTRRYADLLDQHLAPLFDAIRRQTRLAPKILWGNVARSLDAIFEHALELVPTASQVAADREQLLLQPLDAHGRPNPRYRRQRQAIQIVDGEVQSLTLYRQCCLLYRLPDGGYCGPCPLSPAYRHQRAPDTH